MFVDYAGCDFESGPMQNWSLQVLLREFLYTSEVRRLGGTYKLRLAAIKDILKRRQAGEDTYVGIRPGTYSS